MKNHRYKKIYIVVFSCMLNFLGCSSPSISTTLNPPAHTLPSEEIADTNQVIKYQLGEALQGEYSVIYGSVLLGKLQLEEGQYYFVPEKNIQVSAKQVSRFFFIMYPVGSYSIEYRPPVTEEMSLEELEDNDLLLWIRFNTSGIKDAREDFWREHIFLLRYIQDGEILSFSPIWDEFKVWWVFKKWDGSSPTEESGLLKQNSLVLSDFEALCEHMELSEIKAIFGEPSRISHFEKMDFIYYQLEDGSEVGITLNHSIFLWAFHTNLNGVYQGLAPECIE